MVDWDTDLQGNTRTGTPGALAAETEITTVSVGISSESDSAFDVGVLIPPSAYQVDIATEASQALPVTVVLEDIPTWTLLDKPSSSLWAKSSIP